MNPKFIEQQGIPYLTWVDDDDVVNFRAPRKLTQEEVEALDELESGNNAS